MDQKEIYEQKRLEVLGSPDNLDEVLGAVNPFDWTALSAVIIFTLGLCVWFFSGNIVMKINTSAAVSNGVAHFNTETATLKSGLPVKIGDTESSIRDVGINNEKKYIGAAYVPDMADGIYSAEITVNIIKPIDFLFLNINE